MRTVSADVFWQFSPGLVGICFAGSRYFCVRENSRIATLAAVQLAGTDRCIRADVSVQAEAGRRCGIGSGDRRHSAADAGLRLAGAAAAKVALSGRESL